MSESWFIFQVAQCKCKTQAVGNQRVYGQSAEVIKVVVLQVPRKLRPAFLWGPHINSVVMMVRISMNERV